MRSDFLARPWRLAIVLVLAAVAIRALQYGNPTIHIDDQFYLLVGDRMWGGALPYVDIWDRKPVGLFLLYAAIRVLPGDGILAYQLVATLFAAATAFVLARIAARVAPPAAAFVAALLYLLVLMANGGDGGQSPVFYNLLVALAALAVLRVVERRMTLARGGAAAMALFGVAIQVKYTALFEGLYFGIALLVTGWRGGERPARLAALATGWIALALLPTALALGWYVAIGQGEAFVFANFVSIFQRPAEPAGEVAMRAWRIVVHVLPLAIPAEVALSRPAAWHGTPAMRRLLTGWAVAAIAAVAIFGSYFDHYALPLLPPLAAVAAPALLAGCWGRTATAALLAGAAFVGFDTIHNRQQARGTGEDVRAIARRIHGSLYVFNGDPVLYLLTDAPVPTPYVFPPHLSERRDRDALGVDADAEIARIMGTRPRYVVTRTIGPRFPDRDPASFAEMDRALAEHYRLVAHERKRARTLLLYERRDQSRSTSPNP